MDELKQRINEINEEYEANADDWQPLLASEIPVTQIALRPYQVAGVNFILKLGQRGHGGILADEMGLGKTIQTISSLAQIKKLGAKLPFLIVAPLSVVPNWKDEITKFAPTLRPVVYVGDIVARQQMQDQINEDRKCFDVLITTYDFCLNDEAFLSRLKWAIIAVDEGHRLKNAESKLFQALSGFKCKFRLLLTGTPVQNNLREMYALLNFVLPDTFQLDAVEEFVEYFTGPNGNLIHADEFHTLVRPFMLRRIKEEVATDIPRKEEVVLFMGLTQLQKKYYKAILQKNIEAFELGKKAKLVNVMSELRKCVNHPYLFDGVEPEPFELGEHLVLASSKLIMLNKVLELLKSTGHRVLIFSQFTRTLDILQDYLFFRQYSYERLDGSVRGEERAEAVKNFNADKDTFVFLLSTRAGGLGINLTTADTVVFFDSDFNPQADLQAAARVHRIGQTKPVKIIRFICHDTVEQVILRRAERKQRLANDAITNGKFASDESIANVSAEELVKVLKFGLEKLFEEDELDMSKEKLEMLIGQTDTQSHWLPTAQQPDVLEREEQQIEADNIRMFEGTDYTGFDRLAVEARELEVAEQQSKKSKTTSFDNLALPERRKRTPLTDEQKRERAEKMAERKREKFERDRLQKAKAWKDTGYISAAVASDDDEDGDTDDEYSSDENDDELTDNEFGNEEDVEKAKASKLDLKFVHGDATYPQVNAGETAIVLHCVDDSGTWGGGGMFAALAKRCRNIASQYSLAGTLGDLELGQLHVIPMDGDNGVYVGLLIVFTRNSKSNLVLDMDSLGKALKKVGAFAKTHQATVHCPRIGFGMRGVNWYGIERLLRVRLASAHIPTYIYYYKRGMSGPTPAASLQVASATSRSPPTTAPVASSSRPSLKRAASVEEVINNDTEEDAKTESEEEDDEAAEARDQQLRLAARKPPLPNIFVNMRVAFRGLDEKMENQLKRYTIAYGGDVVTDLDDATHVVAHEDYNIVLPPSGTVEPLSTHTYITCIRKKRRLN